MWMTTVQEGGQTYTVAFRGGEIPNAGAPLVDNPRHPTVVEDTQRTLRVLKELDPPRSLWQTGSVSVAAPERRGPTRRLNPRHPTVVEDTQRTLRVLKLDPPRSLCLGSVCTSSDRCPLERR